MATPIGGKQTGDHAAVGGVTVIVTDQNPITKPWAPIARVKAITGCGSFSAFKWNDKLGDLNRFVVVYGGNGTGKSTLSRVFAELESPGTGAMPAGAKAKLVVRTPEGQTKEIDVPGTGDGRPAVRVYSTARTNEYLGIIDRGSLPINLVLGRGQPELQAKLDAARTDLSNLGKDIAAERQRKDKAETRLERHASETARQVKDALRALPSHANYNRSHVEQSWKAMGASTKSTDVALLVAYRGRALEAAGSKKVPLQPPQSLAATVVQVDSLVDLPASNLPPQYRAWIVEGANLHENPTRDSCIFCESAIHEGRRLAIRAIAADDTTSHLQRVAKLAEACKVLAHELRLLKVPDSSEVREAVRAEYVTQREKLDVTTMSMLEALDESVAQLGNIIAGQAAKRTPLAGSHADWQQGLAALNALLQEHNRIVDNHAKECSQAAEAYAQGTEANAFLVVTPDRDEVDDAAKKLVSLNKAAGDKQAEIKTLQDARVNPEISAKDLTRDLAAYFGRSEFEVKPNPADPKFYQLLRYGKPVESLSDGERRAISFVYFLETLRAHDFPRESAVVVIDDPVNSMDEQAVYHAQHFLRERCIGVGQAIVLTHNFPFFRLLKRDATNRMEGDSNLLMVTAGGKPRESTIAPLHAFLKDFESDYHYLFHRVWSVAEMADADPSQSADLEDFMMIPNQARRLLEAFGAFVFPGNSEPSAGATLDGLVGLVKEDDKFYIQEAARSAGAIKGLLNHGSHEATVGGHDPDPAVLLDSPARMKAMLALMRHAEHRHVEGMERKCRKLLPAGNA